MYYLTRNFDDAGSIEIKQLTDQGNLNRGIGSIIMISVNMSNSDSRRKCCFKISNMFLRTWGRTQALNKQVVVTLSIWFSSLNLHSFQYSYMQSTNANSTLLFQEMQDLFLHFDTDIKECLMLVLYVFCPTAPPRDSHRVAKYHQRQSSKQIQALPRAYYFFQIDMVLINFSRFIFLPDSSPASERML